MFVDIVQSILGELVKEQRQTPSSDARPNPKSRPVQNAQSPLTSESSISEAALDPNVGDFIPTDLDLSTYLSRDDNLGFPMDGYDEIGEFNYQLLSDPPQPFDPSLPPLHDSAYGSNGSSTGSPPSYRVY